GAGGQVAGRAGDEDVLAVVAGGAGEGGVRAQRGHAGGAVGGEVDAVRGGVVDDGALDDADRLGRRRREQDLVRGTAEGLAVAGGEGDEAAGVAGQARKGQGRRPARAG